MNLANLIGHSGCSVYLSSRRLHKIELHCVNFLPDDDYEAITVPLPSVDTATNIK